MEQLSLFEDESSAERLDFWSYYCNDDWSVKTKTVAGVPGIVGTEILNLTKEEIIEICRHCESYEKSGPYGYQVFYIEDAVKKELFVRFLNYKARAKWTVIEFINLYFDETVEWFM